MKIAIAIAVATLTTAHADTRRLYVRGGLVHVEWLSSSRDVVLSDVHGAASLAIADGPVAGSGAAIDRLTAPAAIIGYVLPVLDDRFALETVLGPPLHLAFHTTGSVANMSIAPTALGLPTGVPALGSTLGEADSAPPIVTAVYKPVDLGPVQPFVGAGLAVLVSYNARVTNPVLTEVSQPTFHVDPAPGLALQTGIDVRLWRHAYARLDIKYVALMKAHATLEHMRVRTPGLPLFDTVEVGTATMDMWVNPLAVQIGVGYDF